MTQYKFSTRTTGIHYAHFSSIATQEAKEKRKQVLAAVWTRRKIIYQQFQKKMQLQASNDLATIA